jgi:hypothetical protein
MGLVNHMRKLNLIKLVLMRQHQRRMLKYSMKSLIHPKKKVHPKKRQRSGIKLTKEEEQLCDIKNIHRVYEGAIQGDIVDKKILKNLV